MSDRNDSPAMSAESGMPATAPRRQPSLLRRTLFMMVGALLLIGVIALVKVMLVRKMMASFHPPAPPVVTTMTVHQATWRDRIHTIGSVRAWRGADLGPELAGVVRRVRFRSGQDVTAGGALLELDVDDERAQLRSLEAAAALAQTTLRRDRAQWAARAVSRAVIDADEADLRSKRALVDQQRALIEKKIIRAPFSGRLGITTVNPGQYLNPGDKVVSLEAIDRVFVDFTVPQRDVGRMSKGAEVQIAVDAWPSRTFHGRITALGSILDSATRNLQVEATVANRDHALAPGMFATVRLGVGTPYRVIVAPQTAVSFNPYGATVFLAEPGKNPRTFRARRVFVTTGATRGDQVAILQGLHDGDVVVTSGQIKLKNGSPMQVDNTVQPLNDANPTPQER